MQRSPSLGGHVLGDHVSDDRVAEAPFPGSRPGDDELRIRGFGERMVGEVERDTGAPGREI